MIKYDPQQARSEEMGWPRFEDETPLSDAEQNTWAVYTLWSMVVFCVITMFVFMDKSIW